MLQKHSLLPFWLICFLLSWQFTLAQGSPPLSSPPPASYNTGVGVRLDIGEGGAYFGLVGKRFFSDLGAVEAHLLFSDGTLLLGAEYHHHFALPLFPGTKGYIGAGPGLGLGNGTPSVLIRPVAGFQYTLDILPVNLAFDWRPALQLTGGSSFEPERFGLSARLSLNDLFFPYKKAPYGCF
jgi:hypothetical protein